MRPLALEAARLAALLDFPPTRPNLDAIQRMSQSARADGDLLAALQ